MILKLKSLEKNNYFLRYFNLRKHYLNQNELLQLPLNTEDTYNWNDIDQDYRNGLDIITIAFNNTHVLQHQIKKIKENITDACLCHIIADNSSDPEKRKEIRTICQNNNLVYIGIPRLNKKINQGPSESHAFALNWVYYHVIQKRKPKIFGLLDHDIYPLKSQCIADIMGKYVIYGRKSIRPNSWYLWPGFAFFKTEILSGKMVDFSPAKVRNAYLDTGGALWYTLYSQMDQSSIRFADEQVISLQDLGYQYTETVEFYDEAWFHSVNASLWNKDVANYTSAIDDILQKKNEQ